MGVDPVRIGEQVLVCLLDGELSHNMKLVVVPERMQPRQAAYAHLPVLPVNDENELDNHSSKK